MHVEAAAQWDDCWNRIGVWSRSAKTCPQLAAVAHCQNCEVYSRAGKQLLEREAPVRYREQWTENLRQVKQEGEAAQHAALVFRLGNEWFALPSAVLREVAEVRSVHRVPHNQSKVLRGLVNIRGELHLCVSLGSLLEVEKTDLHRDERRETYARILVIESDGARYVFPVSEIKAMHRFATASIRETPSTISERSGTLLRGVLDVDNQCVGLLNAERLFSALGNRLR